MHNYHLLLIVKTILMFVDSFNIVTEGKYIQDEICSYHSKIIEENKSIYKTIDTCTFDGYTYEIIGLSKTSNLRDEVRSGDMLYIPEAIIDNGKMIISKEFTPEIINNYGIQSRNEAFTGTRTALAIKVDAMDTSTTSNATILSDKLFGTGNDEVNLKSQISKCSFGKLNVVPFVGATPKGEFISNGVGEVTVPFNLLNKYEDDAGVEKILDVIKKKYGNLKTQVDHLILVLPKNYGNFIAWAYYFDWLSVYNDEMVIYPSISMHELGHNLGLEHSGKDDNVIGDMSGIMGYGNLIDDDRKCFNAAKSWQLGWYKEGHKTLDPCKGSFEGKLVGIANFDQRGKNKVIIKIVDYAEKKQYFVTFNRKIGMNRGSNQGGDEIIITSRKATSRIDVVSNQRATILEGGIYTIANFGSSDLSLYVKVNNIENNTSPAYADISIFLEEGDSNILETRALRKNLRKNLRKTNKKGRSKDSKKKKKKKKNKKNKIKQENVCKKRKMS